MCVDDELDGLGRELFDLLNEDAGSGRLGVGVDDEDGVVEDDNRGVAIDFVGGLGNGGVDSVCDRLDVEQVVCQAGGREKKEKNCDEHAVHGDISWQAHAVRVAALGQLGERQAAQSALQEVLA